MTKIDQSGAGARLAKLTSDLKADLFDSLESMSAEELDTFLEEDWADATPDEKAHLVWSARKMQRKLLALVAEARIEALHEAGQGRRLAAATTNTRAAPLHAPPFAKLQLAGRDFDVAVAIPPPREIVIIGPRDPNWTYLVIGDERFKLIATSDPNVSRCRGLRQARLQRTLKMEPGMQPAISVV